MLPLWIIDILLWCVGILVCVAFVVFVLPIVFWVAFWVGICLGICWLAATS